jgi:hypothetical protein
MRVAALILALSAMSGGLVACGSDGRDPSNASDAGTSADTGVVEAADTVSCDDPREQAYAPNMQVTGKTGVFTFVLVSSSPAPPADEQNTWVVQVLDANGQPVTGATLSSVTPTMPLMSHGTSTPTIVANGDGTFNVSNVYLFMAGLWEVTMSAKNGTQVDSASFFFCVVG